MCHAREQLGDLLPPGTPPTPFLPRPPPGPVRPLPACPATPWPAGPLRAAGRVGWRAGGRAVDGALPGPGHGAPTWAPLPPGRPGKEGEAAEGAGALGAVEGDPGGAYVPRALRHAGDCAALQLTWACAPPGSRWLEAGCSSECPAFSAPPHPHGDCGRSCSPPPRPSRACGRDPGGACPAPAQRLPSARPAPSQRPAACSATPGGWEGPLHPSSFSPLTRCCRTLTGGGRRSPRRS